METTLDVSFLAAVSLFMDTKWLGKPITSNYRLHEDPTA